MNAGNQGPAQAANAATTARASKFLPQDAFSQHQEIAAIELNDAHALACSALKVNTCNTCSHRFCIGLGKGKLGEEVEKAQKAPRNSSPYSVESIIVGLLVSGVFGDPENLAADCPDQTKKNDDLKAVLRTAIAGLNPAPFDVDALDLPTIPKVDREALKVAKKMIAELNDYSRESFRGGKQNSKNKCGRSQAMTRDYLFAELASDVENCVQQAPQLYQGEHPQARQMRFLATGMGGGKTLLFRWFKEVWDYGKELHKTQINNQTQMNNANQAWAGAGHMATGGQPKGGFLDPMQNVFGNPLVKPKMPNSAAAKAKAANKASAMSHMSAAMMGQMGAGQNGFPDPNAGYQPPPPQMGFPAGQGHFGGGGNVFPKAAGTYAAAKASPGGGAVQSNPWTRILGLPPGQKTMNPSKLYSCCDRWALGTCMETPTNPIKLCSKGKRHWLNNMGELNSVVGRNPSAGMITNEQKQETLSKKNKKATFPGFFEHGSGPY